MIGLPDLVKERKLSKIVINRRLPNIYYYIQGWTQRDCLRGGGGGTSSRRLEPSGAIWSGGVWEGGGGRAHWSGVRGSSPEIFFKIYVSENAFQAILKPSFPYSITSILSKVSHSNPRGRGWWVI